MHVLVTGAAGHLGRALLPALLADTHITTVTAFDVIAPKLVHPRLKVVTGNILGPHLYPAMNGVDIVIHLAFVIFPSSSGPRHDRRTLMRRINVEGTRLVVEQAAAAGVTHFVHASSVAVYGAWPDNPPLIGEDWPRRPTPGFAYAEDKNAAETWLDSYDATRPRLAVTRLRLHAIVGPNALPLIITLARSRLFPRVPEPGPALQCLWEDDAVAALLAAMCGPPGIYNVAAPVPQPYRELARLDGRIALGLPYRAVQLAHGLASRFSNRWGEPGWLNGLRYPLVVATGRAESALNWRARVSVAECMRNVRQLRR